MRERSLSMAQVAYILHEPSPTVCLVLGVYFLYYGMAVFAAVFGLATGVARSALQTRNWAATGVRGEPHRGGCMAERQDFARYRANLQDEIDSAALYRTLADIEAQPQLAEVYRRLAMVEERHAGFWEQRLQAAGQTVPPRRPRWRSRGLSWLAKRFGPQFVLPTIATLEEVGRHMYDAQPETRTTKMPADDRSHARLFRTIVGTSRTGIEGSTVARLEGRHRAVGGNDIRAAVLGAKDGLVANFSLIMGVAGADLSSHGIL